MILLGIDPGTTESGWCVYDSDEKSVLNKGKMDNHCFRNYLGLITRDEVDVIVYEMVACYGMSVGKDVFETVLWLGRFIETAKRFKIERLYRKDVKIALCGSMRAKDANIRQAIIDRFQASGGGKTPQIGTKKNPGPLYGMSGDMWSALALCIAYDVSVLEWREEE